MKQLVFLGGKEIGARCFDCVLSHAKTGAFEVLGVGCSPRGDLLRQMAESAGTRVFETADDIPSCDYIFSVQYHAILKKNHLARARVAAVNLHMAPLPEYRGCNQFSLAILNYDTEFGVTLHLMDEKIDHGDILFESRFPIPRDIWVYDLVKLAERKSVQLFENSFQKVIAGNYETFPQSSRLSEYGTSFTLRNKINDLKIIDLDWDKEKIERTVRATYMPGFEPPYALINGVKVYFSVNDH